MTVPRSILVRITVGCLLMALAGPAAADSAAQEPGAKLDAPALWATIDNDEFVGLNKRDRWYSSGVQIAFGFRDQSPLDPLAASLPCGPIDGRSESRRRAYGLGQNILTQQRRDARRADPDDRPIGALLYLTHQRIRLSDRGDAGWAVELGLTGPGALGEPIQNGLHRVLGVQELGIWSEQLRPYASIGLRAHCRAQRTIGGAPGITWSASWELGLGTVLTQLSTDVGVAIGPGAAQMRPPREARLAWAEPPLRAAWGIIFGLRLRAIARDELLSGDTFGYRNTIKHRDVVGEVFIGARIRLSRRWHLGYAAIRRSREFRNTAGSADDFAPQTYGQITLRRTY